DGRRRVAGREVRGHEVPHRGAQHRGRVAAGQRPDDVALGDDPHHPLAVVGDHERADVVVAQPGDGVGHRRVGRDRRDVPPLAVEDVLDQHGGRLLPRSVVPRRAHLHCPTSRRVVRGDAGTLRGGRSGTPCAAPRASHAGVPTDRLPDHGIDVARARAETPGCEDVVHLDHAGASLPPRAVVDAQVDWLRAEARTGGYALAAARADELEAAYDEVAALLGAHRDEVALVENATFAWHQAFWSLDLRPGDRVLSAGVEYATGLVSMLQARARRGVVVEVLPDDESGALSLDALARALDGDRARPVGLVAVTHVPTNGGLVNPAEEIGRLTRAAGVPYLLDACQSVGQMPVDVEAIGCDLLSATGRKFLRGPRGTGFLYVRRSLLERTEPAPLEPAFLDLLGAELVAPDRYELRPDARRFESWESNLAA